MIAVLTNSIVLALAGLAAAALSCAVSIAKLVDRKRQRSRPSRHEMAASSETICRFDLLKTLPRRRAPLFAAQPMEMVASLRDVSHLFRPGDPMTFSGRSVFGLGVRVVKFSDKSHVAGLAGTPGRWTVIDSCEFVGVTEHDLAETVSRYPGQWYWGILDKHADENFDRAAAVEWARARIGNEYGWASIVFQVAIHTPVLRELAYAVAVAVANIPTLNELVTVSGLAQWVAGLRPFCSGFWNLASRAGGLTLVARRPHQLVTPQDINQTPTVIAWVALVP